MRTGTTTGGRSRMHSIFDTVAFVRENFQVEPDAWQAEALRAHTDSFVAAGR